jgi:hypothetical protein
MSIILQSSGGGSVTIAEPATASNFTLDLPASTGTVLTTTAPKVGNVIQVVQGSTTTSVTLAAGTSFTASNLAASITPSSSSNKVLILVNGAMYGSTTSAEPQGTIYRNNTTNLVGASAQLTDTFSSSGAIISSISIAFLDSPATTSSTTYTFYFKNSVAGNGIFPVNGGTATIVLMEIAA